MTLQVYSTHEKLREVERLIDLERAVGINGESLEILRAIAADLRGRMNGAPSVALAEIERRIVAVHRSRGIMGYSQGSLIGVAQEVIGRWPVVKQALERFGGAGDLR